MALRKLFALFLCLSRVDPPALAYHYLTILGQMRPFSRYSRRGAAERRFDAAHSIPGALKMFGKVSSYAPRRVVFLPFTNCCGFHYLDRAHDGMEDTRPGQ